jgi:hypothetical protein
MAGHHSAKCAFQSSSMLNSLRRAFGVTVLAVSASE